MSVNVRTVYAPSLILDSIDGGLTHQNTEQTATAQTLHRKVRQMNLKFLQDL